MRKVRVFLGIGLLIVFLLSAACTEDRHLDLTLKPGNTNDIQYIDARDATYDLVEQIAIMVGEAFQYRKFDGTRPALLDDSTAISFNEIDSWWVIYEHHDSSGYEFAVRDSVRFENDSVYVQFPDSLLTTKIDFRSSVHFTSAHDSASETKDTVVRFLITDLQSQQINFNGTVNLAYQKVLGVSTDLTETCNVSIWDLKFNYYNLLHEQAYPISGLAIIALDMHSGGQGGSGNATWNITAAFFQDYVHCYFVTGIYYWLADYNYGG